MIEEVVSKTSETTIVATGVLSVVFFALRKMLRSVSTDSLNIKQESVQKDTLTSLHNEIGRLEGLVKGLQAEVNDLKRQQIRFRNKLITAQIALIDVEFSLTNCTCDNVVAIRTKLAEVRRTLLEGEQDDLESKESEKS